ncbi:hypothetical protein ACFL27_01660 [candidate division CSSED10-310 bacterium]|uniref:Uncharacterized protein n=1 Tax=candidate division CSSED10-310 bacterium TaxID=2855610 RepID=A0ABV6YRQ8_UNCC1
MENQAFYLSHLADRLNSINAVRKVGSNPIWHIAASAFAIKDQSRLSKVQDHVLRQAAQNPDSIYLRYDENPHEWEIKGCWENISPSLWKIPTEIDLIQLRVDFLYCGGWQIFAGGSPPQTAEVNLFQDAPAQIIQVMAQYSTQMIIESFFDDLEWALALNPNFLR